MGTYQKTWSRFDLARAQVMYRAGRSCQAIADDQGFSRGYVSARLRSAGTRMRPAHRPRTLQASDVAALQNLRRAGSTWTELAARFHTSRYAAKAACTW